VPRTRAITFSADDPPKAAVGGVGDGHEEGERVLAHPAVSEQGDEAGHHEVVDVGAGHPGVGELAQGLDVLLEGGVLEGVDPAAGGLAVLVEEAAGALAELAVNEPTAFTALVEVARKALPADVNAPRA